MSGVQGAPYVRLESSKPRAGVWMPGTALLLLLPAVPQGATWARSYSPREGSQGQAHFLDRSSPQWARCLVLASARMSHLDPFLCNQVSWLGAGEPWGGWGVGGGRGQHRKRGGGRFLARRLGRPRGVQEQRTHNALRLRRTLLLSDHLSICVTVLTAT